MWWIVDVGFSHAIDENNATQAQEKCLHLDCQSTNIIYRSLDDSIFGEIINKKNAHEIWIYLNEKYVMVSDDKDGEPKEGCMRMLSMTTTWRLWKIAPHGQVMKILMKDQLLVHLTRSMAQYQVMKIIVIFQEQLIIVIVHARMIMLLQAL
jgi:hypothetical protein